MSKALIGLAVILSTFLIDVLPAIGHDAWYPHLHAKDLEKMLKRGEEMKGYILFLTLAFAAFLSILAVFILKRSEEEVARRIEAERARLEKLVAGSAEAAAPLLREGRYAEAIETAVRRYSELCGVSHPEVGIGGAYAVSLRIGGERVSVRLFDKAGSRWLEVRSTGEEVEARALINDGGELKVESFERKLPV